MAGNMAVACSLALLGLLSTAGVVGGQQYPGVTQARYKVVDPTASTLKYKVEAANPKMEVVRMAVAGVAPGCSISTCSEVYEECGWCEKDGGFAVGYTKEEEIVGDTHRTTMTLGKECKGIFVYDATKCPETNKKDQKVAESSSHPQEQAPTESYKPQSVADAQVPSVQYVSVPVHDPALVLHHHPAAVPYQHAPIQMPGHGPHNLVPMSN